MNLFDRVVMHVKSFGHAIEGEEHKLLNEFVAYLGSDKVVSGFSDSPVGTLLLFGCILFLKVSADQNYYRYTDRLKC